MKSLWRNVKAILKLLPKVARDIGESFNAPKPIFVITIAVLLVLVGQIGIILPFFPGLVLTLPGLILLSLYSPTIYRFMKQRFSGHPKLESIADRTRNWLIKIVRPRQ